MKGADSSESIYCLVDYFEPGNFSKVDFDNKKELIDKITVDEALLHNDKCITKNVEDL